MPREKENEFSPEWIYDHHLDKGAPLWAVNVDYSGPMPLDIHLHEGIEVGLLLRGEYDISFGRHSMHVQAGDVWLVSTYEPHAHGTRSAHEWEVSIVVVIFLPEFIGDEVLGERHWLNLLAIPPEKRPRVLTRELRESVLGIGHELREEIAEQRPAWQSMVRLDLLRLFIRLSRDWNPGSLRGTGGSALSRIGPALALAHRDPAKHVTTEEAAGACGFSRSRFDALFHEATSMTFTRFRLRARLAFVAQRLLHTAASVEAIAEAAGFADRSHLHRSFLKQYGCTPGDYRERGKLVPTSLYDRVSPGNGLPKQLHAHS
jgi:AraC-like DNA-binding protein